MIETVRTQRWSLALALVAAAITAACAVIAQVGLLTGLWRCVVAFASVWVYQRLLVKAWAVLEPEPIVIRVSAGRARRR